MHLVPHSQAHPAPHLLAGRDPPRACLSAGDRPGPRGLSGLPRPVNTWDSPTPGPVSDSATAESRLGQGNTEYS
eukprot:1461537-Rhodomonas_salina.1